MKPTVGRIVHYVDGDENHVAAIIASVYPLSNRVNLAVFDTDGVCYRAVGIYESQDEKRQDTWHWPEREEPSA